MVVPTKNLVPRLFPTGERNPTSTVDRVTQEYTRMGTRVRLSLALSLSCSLETTEEEKTFHMVEITKFRKEIIGLNCN